jgi:addiction module RelB/DinJ family antitoxin
MNSFFRAFTLCLIALLLVSGCADEAQQAATPPAASEAHDDDHDAGPADDHADEAGAEDEHGDHGDAAPRWDAASLAAAGIRIAPLQRQALSESLRAPGEVVDNAYGTTLITPRIEALVVKRHAKLGDEVAAGAPLATLSSIEVAGAQAALRLAEQEWTRVQALGREAVSGRRYSEAQIAVEQARATAKAYGLSARQRGLADGEFRGLAVNRQKHRQSRLSHCFQASSAAVHCLVQWVGYNVAHCLGELDMAANAVVRARIDETIKDEATVVLASMGLTVSDAFRLMLTRVAREKALPFEPLIPNETTIAAMREARAGNLPRVNTVDELLAELHAGD